jgi:hypothetical protein
MIMSKVYIKISVFAGKECARPQRGEQRLSKSVGPRDDGCGEGDRLHITTLVW